MLLFVYSSGGMCYQNKYSKRSKTTKRTGVKTNRILHDQSFTVDMVKEISGRIAHHDHKNIAMEEPNHVIQRILAFSLPNQI